MYSIYNNFCYDNNNNVIRDLILPENIQNKNYDSWGDLSNKPIINFDTVLYFSNRFDENIGHFMSETFHLLECFFDDKIDKSKIKILIRKDYYENKSYLHKQILEILDLLDYVCVMENDTIYKANNFINSKHRIFVEKEEDTNYTKLVNKLIKNSRQKSSIECVDNIYLSRKHIGNGGAGQRFIENHKEMSDIINKYKYKTYRVDNLKFYDQITIINSAKNIIIEICAGCENIRFVNKNCKFSIIYPKILNYWVNMYNQSKNFVPIECLNIVKLSPTHPTGDRFSVFNADLDKLEKLLKKNNIKGGLKKKHIYNKTKDCMKFLIIIFVLFCFYKILKIRI